MIHERIDIERWIAMFPLVRVRAEAEARVLVRREQDPDGWLELAVHSESMTWWWEHERGRFPMDRARAVAGVLEERARDPETWDRRRIEMELSIASPRAEHITSPVHLAVAEQSRAEMRSAVELGPEAPSDVFIWSKGEPSQREITKLGGLPYWPAERTWPERPDSGPMMFVGQVCFADSRDITGDLPGDVLLVFAHPEPGELWNPGGMLYEWLPLGISHLIDVNDAPDVESVWKVGPHFGAIHRTVDYSLLGNGGGNFGMEHPDWSGNGRLLATKIGGVPWWEQVDPEFPGRFLCAIEALGPATDVPYPFLNRPEPIDQNYWQHEGREDLDWGDAGRLNVLVDAGRLYWEFQFG